MVSLSIILFIITLVVSVVASMPVFVMGLIVEEVISHPLTLLVMGILAGLTASWMSNRLSRDSTYSRILHIVGATQVIAVLLILLRFVFPFYIMPTGNKSLLATWGVILSLSACFAARRFRSSELNRKRDIIMTLILLVGMPVVVVATIAIASLFGLTGA